MREALRVRTPKRKQMEGQPRAESISSNSDDSKLSPEQSRVKLVTWQKYQDAISDIKQALKRLKASQSQYERLRSELDDEKSAHEDTQQALRAERLKTANLEGQLSVYQQQRADFSNEQQPKRQRLSITTEPDRPTLPIVPTGGAGNPLSMFWNNFPAYGSSQGAMASPIYSPGMFGAGMRTVPYVPQLQMPPAAPHSSHASASQTTSYMDLNS